ncbi:MAG: hypothetical protein J6P83_00995 [Bacteroidales bacterium]|nr:hypothetical protein [Bacteroidales bacterium]
MNKFVVFAVLMAVALGVKAQSPTVTKTEIPNDSVSIMFHSLQNTNAEMARLNQAYNTNATMISVGGALQLIGTGMTLLSSNESMQKVGMVSSLVGMGFVVLSILPMPKGVSVDERGLVVDLPSKKKK